VRRTAKTTGAARSSSGGKESEEAQPSGRWQMSKRYRAHPSGLTEPAAPGPRGVGAVAESELEPGLYLVATPIGNLADITLRALAVLRDVDRIYCEDTRVTSKLLAKYGISTPLAPYHDHNADEMRPAIVRGLRRGEKLALVSDAGTPLVSDPGYKLVRTAVAEHLPITAVPGPSAAVTALILSGLPTDAFLFAGFLPPRQVARRHALERWAAVEASLIFFESAPRLVDSLAEMAAILGNRPAAVARELTKLHEEVRRGGLADLADHYRGAGPPRGEAVIVIAPPVRSEPEQATVEQLLRTALATLSLREAAAKVAAETGVSRGKIYRRALAIKGETE
jgi:16S rRNA (cytidine1402-2'-O)-methyltransferase